MELEKSQEVKEALEAKGQKFGEPNPFKSDFDKKVNKLNLLAIFGLSKIISSQEKMVDGFGTLSYVAPEVLTRSPYNKEVDIWSLGIILFYILSGHLPFKGNKEIIIAEKIVNDDLDFDEEEWKKKSKNAKELISSCLKKEPDERITIDEFLNHPWIKKFKIQQKNSI